MSSFNVSTTINNFEIKNKFMHKMNNIIKSRDYADFPTSVDGR